MVKLNLPKEATFKGPALIWKRVAAFFIDMLIIDFVVGFPFRSLFTKIMPMDGFSNSYGYLSANPRLTSALSLIMFIYGLLALLYFAILEYQMGQTLGKMFFNLKVQSDNKEKNFFAYIIRNMFLILVFPFVLLWIVDPLFMFFTKDKRRLSEILSRTRTTAVYLLK